MFNKERNDMSYENMNQHEHMNNCCEQKFCEPIVCQPIIECPEERCEHREIHHEVPHIIPINTRIINHHIYKHVYIPKYTCCEENEVTNICEKRPRF